MTKLQLKDISIGKTDAKNEFIENTDAEKDIFLQGFLIPDNIIPEDFLEGKRYYITGLKGTGKTALLRYLGIIAEKELDAKTAFILFKSDIGEDDKTNIDKAAEIIIRNEGDSAQFKDYELPWMWFLFSRMVKLIDNLGVRPFNDNEAWFKFRTGIVSTIKKSSPSYSLFPKIKNGKITVDTSIIKATVDFENAETSKKERDEVDFVKLVKECEELFRNLSPTGERLYIFIDELELSLGIGKKYQRDVELIRDLIIAIHKFNAIARTHKYGVYCITGIRREVLAATQSSGKEINKPISDFGIGLHWQQSGQNVLDHPLIKMIHKRLMAAESKCKIHNPAKEEEIWNRYFPELISEKPAQEFILNRTWYRPRDIIRLLGLAQQQFPNETKFSQRVIESINKDFSTESWEEQKEELTANYSKKEIDGIEHLLAGITCPFSLNDFSRRCGEMQKIYDDVESLLSTRKPATILSDLYTIGVIGNTGEKMRYAFRGDAKLLLTQNMTIHLALWNVLAIKKRFRK